jgi:hypothetical protein
MLRFIARFLGFWLIAGALVAAVVDGAKSIAASSLVLTPVTETYSTLATFGRPEGTEVAIPTAPPPFDAALDWVMAAPTAAVLIVLGVFFVLLGVRRRRPFLSREFAA